MLKAPQQQQQKQGRKRWTTQDHMQVWLNIFIKLGDSVQIYLPGVITQIVSCELGVSQLQEKMLGVALYVTLAITTPLAALISNRLGRRPVLMFSLYTCILSTVLCCSVNQNYWALLVALILTGACVGLNISTSQVYMAENISAREIYELGTFVDSIFFAAGGGWVAVLGYFILGHLDWRLFVLLTSLPLFVPPIIILHCCASSNTGQPYIPLNGEGSPEPDIWGTEASVLLPRNVGVRIAKASLMNFLNILQGFGSILLIPVLLRFTNEHDETRADSCSNAVQGSQFLIFALVTGGCNVAGRILGYFVHRRFSFRLTQTILSTIIVICFIVMLVDNLEHVSVIACAMGAVNMVYSMTRLSLKIMECDIGFFGPENVALASGIILGVGHTGAIAGTIVAEAFDPITAVVVFGAASVLLVLVSMSMREYSKS